MMCAHHFVYYWWYSGHAVTEIGIGPLVVGLDVEIFGEVIPDTSHQFVFLTPR